MILVDTGILDRAGGPEHDFNATIEDVLRGWDPRRLSDYFAGAGGRAAFHPDRIPWRQHADWAAAEYPYAEDLRFDLDQMYGAWGAYREHLPQHVGAAPSVAAAPDHVLHTASRSPAVR